MEYSKSMMEAFLRDKRDYLLAASMVRGGDRLKGAQEELRVACNIIEALMKETQRNEEAR
jgi:hypothetical protein